MKHQFKIAAGHDEHAVFDAQSLGAKVCFADVVRLEAQGDAMASRTSERNWLAQDGVDGDLRNDGGGAALVGERNAAIVVDLRHVGRLVWTVDKVDTLPGALHE